MKKILQQIDKWIADHIRLDDALHFIVGMILSEIIAILAMLLLGPVPQFGLICCIAFMGSTVVAIAKEGVDTNIKGEDLERRDIFWTMMGSVTMIILLVLFRSVIINLV